MKYCSLGDSCMPSFSLKALGLKSESYPFDWVNSKSNIVKLCIEDEFKDFLDKSLYSEHKNEYDAERVCQHNIYVDLLRVNPIYKQIFFRHRDPLGNDKDYEYYVRCVDRFKSLLSSDEQKIFIKVYVNSDESKLEDVLDLTNFLKDHTTNYTVIAINHSVTGAQSFKIEKRENLVYVEITSVAETDGGTFYNHTDQTFFNSLLEYLIHDIRQSKEIR